MAEIDPLQTDGQGEDTGDNYRTGIYTHDAAQEKVRKVVQGRLRCVDGTARGETNVRPTIARFARWLGSAWAPSRAARWRSRSFSRFGLRRSTTSGEFVLGVAMRGGRCVLDFSSAPHLCLPFCPSTNNRYLEKGGVCRRAQSAAKGCKEPIRCYG